MARWLVVALTASCAHAQTGPDVRGAQKTLASQLVSAGELDQALAVVNDLDAARPDDPQVLTLRGIIYSRKALWAEAERDLRAALGRDEKNAPAHAALGMVLDLTGRGAEAEKHHRRAVVLAPRYVAYQNNLAFSLHARGKARDAIEVYRGAIELDPLSATIRNNAGFAYADAGDMRAAAAEFARGGTPAQAQNNLGFAYERRGDLAHAFESYVAALRLDPALALARENLRHVAAALGRPVPPDLAPDLPSEPTKEQSP